MKKGVSLHVGINRIDKEVYGTDGALRGPQNDATAMARLADRCGFDAGLLLTEDATRRNVIRLTGKAARILQAGDIFLLTYAGHGTRVPDKSATQADGFQKAWVLYDGLLTGDELYQLWSGFRTGVRIVVTSDSCHSGTVTRGPKAHATRRYRQLDLEAGFRAWARDRSFHESVSESVRKLAPVGATVLLLSACQNDQLAQESAGRGLFTKKLLNTWNRGRFMGSYGDFHASIREQMPDRQIPNYFRIGRANAAFEGQLPFTVDAP